MDLKKNKKLKRKYNSFQMQVRKFVGYHLYRSANYFAPFDQWERLTAEPMKSLQYTDKSDEGDDTLYHYKFTEVDIHGKESAPQTPEGQFWIKDGEKIERNAENDIVGYNVYRSTDRDLPLDQWERRNPEPLPDTEYQDGGIETGVTYHYYITSLSRAGLESKASKIVSVVGK